LIVVLPTKGIGPNGTLGRKPPSVKVGRRKKPQSADERARRSTARRRTERVQGFLTGVRTRDPFNELDSIILMNEEPGDQHRPAPSILTLKHQPRVPS
jgi:hypothetical protein